MPKLIDHVQRRCELAEAVWRVVVKEGISAVSVRTVAAEAGVAAGSLRHVFPRQDDLLIAALELVQENARTRIMAIPSAWSGKKRAMAIASELLPLDQARRSELEVQLSLITLAFSNAGLRPVRDAANAAVLFACQRMLTLLADEHPLSSELDLILEAHRLHALLDGLATHLLHAADQLTPEQALTVLDNHLASLTASSDTTRPTHPTHPKEPRS